MKEITPIIAAVIGFLVTFLSGFFAIPYLKKLKFGQTIREDGPTWHSSKQGTPTMGGIMIALGLVVALVIAVSVSHLFNTKLADEFSSTIKLTGLLGACGLGIGMGLIGFFDDYIKVVKKRNLGLTAKQKTFLQLLVSAAFLASLALTGVNTTWIPFVGDVDILHGVGLIYWPIALMGIYGFTNAVNLTDGVDGLASTVTMVVSCCFMLISGHFGFIAINALSAALAGACIGFVVWNGHPAKVFMGDTGSMFLGGIIVGIAFAIGRPILLLIAGIVYLLEAFSVILQVAYYKKTKKRIFKMTPIHHHFELSGYSEEKIVIIFSLVALMGGLISVLLSVLI